MNNDTIGVDVSKDYLDAHRLADGAARRFANDRAGRKALIKWLAADAVDIASCSNRPAPIIARSNARWAIAGVPFAKVNPRQARRFAEADRQAGEDRSRRMRRCWRAWAPCSICRRAPASKRDHARTEGASSRSRGAGQGSHRRQEPRKGV